MVLCQLPRELGEARGSGGGVGVKEGMAVMKIKSTMKSKEQGEACSCRGIAGGYYKE